MTELVHTDITFTPPLGPILDAYFLHLGFGVEAETLRRERLDILLWLNAKSDADLAAIGLRRDDIPAWVFRDLFGSPVRGSCHSPWAGVRSAYDHDDR